MTGPSPTARAAAERLWARFAPPGQNAEFAAAAAAQVHHALRLQLQRWLGMDGYRALYGRAHDLARVEHPAITGLAPRVHEPSIGALAARAPSRDDIDGAIECLLAYVIDLLARIIGTDMAVRLMDQVVPVDHRDGPRTTSEGDHDG